MFYQRGVSSFKFGVSCFVDKKLKAIVHFWRRNIRKLSHVIKGRSDFYSSLTFLSEIWRGLLVNNSMNRWILSSPRNVGTHLNWREVVNWMCVSSEATVVINDENQKWITRFLFITMLIGRLSSTHFWHLLYSVGMVFLLLSFAPIQY